MKLKERLVQVIKELGLSGRAFERECGLTTGAFAGFGDRIGADILNKILVRYPQISARWLITGEGEMFVQLDDSHDCTAKILERFVESLECQKQDHNSIVYQNGEIVKQNSAILQLNASVIQQNAQLIKQNAEAMAIIKKLSEKLR